MRPRRFFWPAPSLMLMLLLLLCSSQCKSEPMVEILDIWGTVQYQAGEFDLLYALLDAHNLFLFCLRVFLS